MDSTGSRGAARLGGAPIVLGGRWAGSLVWTVLLVAGGCGQEPPSGAEAPREALRVAVSLSGTSAADGVTLRALARELEFGLDLMDAHGRESTQRDQLSLMLSARPDALVLAPASIDIATAAELEARALRIPLVILGEGDVGAGLQVGPGVTAGAREQAADLRRQLADEGIELPRVVGVHDARWPGAVRRVDAVVRALEDEGPLRLLRKVGVGLGEAGELEAPDAALVFDAGADGGVDAVVCADEASTRAVLKVWVTRSERSERPWLVGVGAQDELVLAAENEPRLRLLHYQRTEQLRIAVERALEGESSTPARPLSMTLPDGRRLERDLRRDEERP